MNLKWELYLVRSHLQEKPIYIIKKVKNKPKYNYLGITLNNIIYPPIYSKTKLVLTSIMLGPI